MQVSETGSMRQDGIDFVRFSFSYPQIIKYVTPWFKKKINKKNKSQSFGSVAKLTKKFDVTVAADLWPVEYKYRFSWLDLFLEQFKGHPAAKEDLWNVPNSTKVPEGLWSAHLKQNSKVRSAVLSWHVQWPLT